MSIVRSVVQQCDIVDNLKSWESGVGSRVFYPNRGGSTAVLVLFISEAIYYSQFMEERPPPAASIMSLVFLS